MKERSRTILKLHNEGFSTADILKRLGGSLREIYTVIVYYRKNPGEVPTELLPIADFAEGKILSEGEAAAIIEPDQAVSAEEKAPERPRPRLIAPSTRKKNGMPRTEITLKIIDLYNQGTPISEIMDITGSTKSSIKNAIGRAKTKGEVPYVRDKKKAEAPNAENAENAENASVTQKKPAADLKKDQILSEPAPIQLAGAVSAFAPDDIARLHRFIDEAATGYIFRDAIIAYCMEQEITLNYQLSMVRDLRKKADAI